jgi:hypothetical protein
MSYEALVEGRERNVRLLEISPELILDLFKVDESRQVTIGGRVLDCVQDAIPATATVASCGINERGNVLVHVQDTSFSPVEFGAVVPRIDPVFRLTDSSDWRPMEIGEFIQLGDQFEAVKDRWRPAPPASIGIRVELWHCKYRTKRRSNT